MSKFHQKQIGFVAHAEIRVKDLSVSLPFYTSTLGFQVIAQDRNVATLGTKEMTPILTLRQLENGAPKLGRTAGLYHFALLVPNRKELGKILLHFIQNNVDVQGASNHGISEAIYLADPDGNGIEIAADTDQATWPPFERPVEWFSVNGPMDIKSVLEASENEPFDRLPANTVFGHLHLHVSELEKTKEFYQTGLGMDVVMEFPESAIFLSYGRYHHHIAVNVWNGKGVKQPAESNPGLANFDLILPDQMALDGVSQRLEKLGYPVTLKNNALWVKDPSGNQMRISA